MKVALHAYSVYTDNSERHQLGSRQSRTCLCLNSQGAPAQKIVETKGSITITTTVITV